MAEARKDLPEELLKATSRTFYLTLRVLPAAVRPQIGLAYLLARTTDTIADTEIVPLEQRFQALQALRDRILGLRETALNFSELARQQALPAERTLLEKAEANLALLKTLSPADLQLVRAVLDTITSGQELDLRRFARPLESTLQRAGDNPAPGGNEPRLILALRSDSELEDYTYRVAGCVGEFWTKLCRAHLYPTAPLDEARALADGVRFGKGLQLVNILRDLPVDLRKGRCYLPADRLTEVGLAPADLLQPANEARLRPIYNGYLDRTEADLAAGWDYTNRLPRRPARVRLACAWPILIGLKTIGRLRTQNVLDPEQRIKASRSEVRGLIVRSVVCYLLPRVWHRLASLPASAPPSREKPAPGKAVASDKNLT